MNNLDISYLDFCVHIWKKKNEKKKEKKTGVIEMVV